MQETQLADTFAQNDMSRYGMLFAPSDTGIGDAYAKAVDSGLSYSEWLEWASKVPLSSVPGATFARFLSQFYSNAACFCPGDPISFRGFPAC